MRVIILCGGFGTRLGSLGSDTPKALMSICDVPLIEWILEQLVDLDFVTAIGVVHNQLFKDQFETWSSGYSRGSKIVLLNNGVEEEGKRIGAVGDISGAVDFFGSVGPVTIFPGDTVFNFNIKKFFYAVKRNPESGWLSLRVEKDERKRRLCGVVDMDEDGHIHSFVEKPNESNVDYVYKGPCYFPPVVVNELSRYCSDIRKSGNLPDDMGDFISWALKRITFRGCVMHSGECIDIGSLRDYRAANIRLQRDLDDYYG